MHSSFGDWSAPRPLPAPYQGIADTFVQLCRSLAFDLMAVVPLG